MKIPVHINSVTNVSRFRGRNFRYSVLKTIRSLNTPIEDWEQCLSHLPYVPYQLANLYKRQKENVVSATKATSMVRCVHACVYRRRLSVVKEKPINLWVWFVDSRIFTVLGCVAFGAVCALQSVVQETFLLLLLLLLWLLLFHSVGSSKFFVQ